MVKLNRKEIQSIAMKILEENPSGIRWMDLLRRTAGATQETPENSVHGAIHALISGSSAIRKISRGFYQLSKYEEMQSEAAIQADELSAKTPVEIVAKDESTIKVLESDFFNLLQSGLRMMLKKLVGQR